MKIAVILTRFLKDYVESYFNSLSLDCELSYYIYNDFAHAGELYLELEKSYDGFLVSGPAPRAAVCRRVSGWSTQKGNGRGGSSERLSPAAETVPAGAALPPLTDAIPHARPRPLPPPHSQP